MIVLAYLMIPVMIVAVYACIAWLRNRQPSSLESGVDSFRREMDALSPGAAPNHRRRTEGPAGREAEPPRGPRRPRSSDRP